MNPTAQTRRISSHDTQRTSWSSWASTWPLSASTRISLCLRGLTACLMWSDSLRTTLIWPPTRGYRKDYLNTLLWWESTLRGMQKSPETSPTWSSSRSWCPCWYLWGKRCWFLICLKCSHLCQVCIFFWLLSLPCMPDKYVDALTLVNSKFFLCLKTTSWKQNERFLHIFLDQNLPASTFHKSKISIFTFMEGLNLMWGLLLLMKSLRKLRWEMSLGQFPF